MRWPEDCSRKAKWSSQAGESVWICWCRWSNLPGHVGRFCPLYANMSASLKMVVQPSRNCHFDKENSDEPSDLEAIFRQSHVAVCQNLVPLVNIKIAGKWMFIPLKMVLIGIDPYPCQNPWWKSHAPLSATEIHSDDPSWSSWSSAGFADWFVQRRDREEDWGARVLLDKPWINPSLIMSS